VLCLKVEYHVDFGRGSKTPPAEIEWKVKNLPNASLRPCLRPAAAKRTLATATRSKKFITPKTEQLAQEFKSKIAEYFRGRRGRAGQPEG